MRTTVSPSEPRFQWQILQHRDAFKSLSLSVLMLLSTFASIPYISMDALAASDQDGDGLTYGLEYLMNTAPNDPDSDNDGLPDGWEWQFGLDPLSSNGGDGAVGDPDGDGMSNLQEYSYLQPQGWDSSSTPGVLDNGVWWNGTVPVNDWDEENALQYNRPGCGDSGSDGVGNVILCDEDPVGNICANGFDDDKDGLVDSADPDNDGDADCSSNDDDGDGIADEDVAGWDTDGDGMDDGWEAANGLNATSASNADGPNGDPDGDGLNNLMEYVNPTWTTMCGVSPCFRNGPDGLVTETTTPCDPVSGIGPGGCATFTAEVDGITSTNPQRADTDGDGLNDSYEALTLLTDPTSSDTDGDGIDDGVEVNGAYGNPPQASNPRDNNTDGDAFDDGEEDTNFNGVLDPGETDPTRMEDSGDEDNDGIQNWEENLSCTSWDIADTDFGGINDGDERNVSHGTDPCDSLINFETTIVSWNGGTSQLQVFNGSGFNPSGGVGWYNNSGTWISFAYAGTVNNAIQGVSSGPTAGVTQVSNRNGSFCHTSATSSGTIGTTQRYCDDDYTDSDGDGLADWQELLGTFGWFSNPTLADTDADGVSDFDEVFDNTDPNQPCTNLLDDDLDGLNNYFETTTGCDLSWIGILNGSTDVWVTDDATLDTDAGGVNDRNEYFDGTNPENDPTDDLLPADFDGDRIPDAVENQTGTDWTNPDTDGGGMIDGLECTQEFWVVGCVGSPFDPFDPTDDLVSSEVVFWANNTTGTVDTNLIHRWRLTTNDFYTGTTYAHLEDIHPYEIMVLPSSNMTHLADLTFSNETIDWQLTYRNPVTTGNLPVSYSLSNLSFYVDIAGELQRSNDTHNIEVLTGPIQEAFVQQPEYYFDWATLASTTVAGTNSSYELILPTTFNDPTHPHSYLLNVTNAVITEASATNAYDSATALQTFLSEGNATTEFKRNYNGSGIPSSEDLSVTLIQATKEGTCSEFNTAFVTMARLAGLPTRLVTGFSGGIWNGDGYSVYPTHMSTWGEVRLQQNSANGDTELGWIPFDACPPAEEVEIVNQSISSMTIDRDGGTFLNVSGHLRYSENMTSIGELPVIGYLVPMALENEIPGQAAIPNFEIGSSITLPNGTFSFNGSPPELDGPGMYRVVVRLTQAGYVAESGIIFDGYINVTDDSVINHTAPNAINAPIAGAGAMTVIEGILSLENAPNNKIENIGVNDLTPPSVWLSFTSSVNGFTNLSSFINIDGSWSFDLDLDPLETKTNLSATLGFSGWQDTQATSITPSQFHLRPSTTSIVIDVRDAPNLTATLEGPLANKSIILINDDLWINGSALTTGASPVAMAGNLSFSIRENGTTQEWSQVFNRSVNGVFSIQHLLATADAQVMAGNLEVQIRFFPNAIEATDDANVSAGEPYLLRGFLEFEVQATAQLRGAEATVLVTAMDHRGVSTDLLITGNFDFTFNGNWVNTTVDPSTETMTINWLIDSTLFADDYLFEISFNGSELYQPSLGNDMIRVAAEVAWNLSLGQDWTHLGNSSYLFGDIFDAQYTNISVLGDNITMLSIIMMTPDGMPIDLAQGFLNNTTGSFLLNFTIPTTRPSDSYEFILNMDFDTMAPPGGAYFRFVDNSVPPAMPTLPSTLVGVESEFVVEPEREKMIVEINQTLDFNTKITDVADKSNVSGASVEYIFDWGNTNVSMDIDVSDAEGNSSIQWTAAGVSPGYYDVLVIVYDDLTDGLGQGNSRRTGNSSIVNLTVQVPSEIRIDSIPSVTTAGLNFNVLGQVLDGDNSSRPLTTPVEMSAFWLNNPGEILVAAYQTSPNGTFNMSIPTDTTGNGTERGNKILVISVNEGSSPFYLTATTQNGILVMGVSQFNNLQPLNPVTVNRGDTINITGRLLESSNLFAPLSGFDVDIQFHETWLAGTQTDGEGFANFSHQIPMTHPLGLIVVSLVFNGSSDLLNTQVNLSSVTIRSTTIMIVDPITTNPVAGTSFNVTGLVVSDNGSGLEQRDGSVLPSNILFSINGQPTGFTVTGGSVMAGGIWAASILLGEGFEAGNNSLAASYVPNVNYYVGSTNNTSFDSRGFTTLVFIQPALDALGSPSLNDRTERGNDVQIQVLLRDNTMAAVGSQQVVVTLIGTDVSTTLTTFANGTAVGFLTVPSNQSIGFNDLEVSFSGIPGTTGLIGSNASTQFAVLAQTNMVISTSPSTLVAGDSFTVQGTLLDDLNQTLTINGVSSVAIVHLLVDGVPVSSVETDAVSGNYSIGWTLPEDTAAGAHLIEVRYLGGRDWVDPIGVGDPANPDFYLPSSAQVNFNVSVPTKIILLTPSGTVDREASMTLQGRLLDLVDSPLENLTVEVWLGGQWMTNVTTDDTGLFTAVYPVPSDAQLGPISLEIHFTGTTFYLPSNATGIWTVYSQVLVSVSMDTPVAVGQN
ncbi:MAG: transglutaminase domain-containing protein, partial [Euryarchaeota archaeon]|nr:transglutaminase domain-containing protein [Euryarchaeota archaeon]